MTAIDYEGAFEEPPMLARVLHLGPRSGAVVGLGFWLTAWAVLGLHVAHAAGLGGGLVFVCVEFWLLTGAGLGLPAMSLRILGSQLSPHTCIMIGGALSACMITLTVLYGTGAFAPRPANAMVGLSLCGGMAMRCFNAADALRSMRKARAAHRTDCVMVETVAQHQLAEALAPLTTEQRVIVLDILSAAARTCTARPGLHAVDDGAADSA